jgi:small GTP-binding protein
MLKLLLLGDTAVGKSCLLLRYTDGTFQESFLTTVGIDFKIRQIELDGKPVRLQIWDTAGQEQFRTITRAYYRGAHGVAVVFDLTRSASFEQCQGWISSIRESVYEPVEIVLVGNKSDRDRVVEFADAESFARDCDVKYFETSAKTGDGIDAMFLELARGAIANRGQTGVEEKRTIVLSSKKKQSSGCC